MTQEVAKAAKKKKNRKIIWFIVGGVVIAAAVATPLIIATKRKSNEEEVAALINLAGEEHKLKPGEVARLREIYNIKYYQLPAAYLATWDKISPKVREAISAIKAGNFVTANQIVSQAASQIPANQRQTFQQAYKLFVDLTSAMMDLQNVAEHKGWLVKAGRYAHTTNSLLKWNVFFSPSMLVAYINTWTGIDQKFQETAAIKDNPIYLVNKDLIFNNNYSKDVLKIFDMIWQITKGENYFNINANSVSLK